MSFHSISILQLFAYFVVTFGNICGEEGLHSYLLNKRELEKTVKNYYQIIHQEAQNSFEMMKIEIESNVN